MTRRLKSKTNNKPQDMIAWVQSVLDKGQVGSQRSWSLAAGFGPNTVQNVILRGGATVETIIGLCDAAGEDRKEAFIACGYLRESDLGRSVLKESERNLLTHVRHLKPKTLESLTEIAQALRLRDEGRA